MNNAGIVAEYNPFHTGHGYQVRQTRAMLERGGGIVAVMSGNWVQQANCAIADKWTRARLALMGGVDLVLELPTVWAMSSAESFARGAVALLEATGVVDTLSFGSECGEADKLERVALCLNSGAYQERLREYLDQGMTFAACRQRAVESLLGEDLGGLLARPNNNLGIEYIRALEDYHSQICHVTVPRRGAGHNGVLPLGERPEFLSATQIRALLRSGNWSEAEPYLVPGGRELLEQTPWGLPNLERVSRSMLARVRTMGAEDWARLPDAGAEEGLTRRLERAGARCTSMEEFFTLSKSKRYTHARLRRLALWAWLGLTEADVPETPPYLRVLGFNQRGQLLLKEMRKRAALPVLTKPAHARQLDAAGRRLFELEARCTDLYDLCFETVPTPGREWTTGPVILPQERGEGA